MPRNDTKNYAVRASSELKQILPCAVYPAVTTFIMPFYLIELSPTDVYPQGVHHIIQLDFRKL